MEDLFNNKSKSAKNILRYRPFCVSHHPETLNTGCFEPCAQFFAKLKRVHMDKNSNRIFRRACLILCNTSVGQNARPIMIHRDFSCCVVSYYKCVQKNIHADAGFRMSAFPERLIRSLFLFGVMRAAGR